MTDFQGKYGQKEVGTRYCTEKDFSQSEFTLNYYKNNKKVYGKNYEPICLDKEALLANVMKGTAKNEKQTRFYLRINLIKFDSSRAVDNEVFSFINTSAVKKQQVYQYIDSDSTDSKGLIKYGINDEITDLSYDTMVIKKTLFQ